MDEKLTDLSQKRRLSFEFWTEPDGIYCIPLCESINKGATPAEVAALVTTMLDTIVKIMKKAYMHSEIDSKEIDAKRSTN